MALNTADEEELQDLPGVGPATAEDIISYQISHRRTNGLFRSVEVSEVVSGTGSKTLEEIEPVAEV